jgi:hypothetical protein
MLNRSPPLGPVVAEDVKGLTAWAEKERIERIEIAKDLMAMSVFYTIKKINRIKRIMIGDLYYCENRGIRINT